MTIRTPAYRLVPFAALAMVAFSPAFGCKVAFESACDDRDICSGEEGGDRSSESSGGRSSGSSDGGSGGLGGELGPGGAGGSGVAGEGMGGEGPTEGSGGGSVLATVPVLTAALVGGVELEDGETVLGLGDGPEIVFRFSEPMDKKSVQEAYLSENKSIDAAHVAFSWNQEVDELRVIPLTPLKHAEVSDPEAESELFTVSLQKGAKSRAGVEMKQDFEASFQLKKRVTYSVIPDLRKSLWRAEEGGISEAMISEEGLFPDYQGFFCPVFVSTTQPEEAGSLLLGYEVINNGIYPAAYQSYVSLDLNDPSTQSAGIYVFPLPGDIESLENASLKVVKWYGTVGNASDGKLSRADFSVDALASDEAGVPDWTGDALVADLMNTSGNDSSYGYGPFEFDVTVIVGDGVDREDNWSVFRLALEEINQAEQPFDACAAASLTIIYWAL